ncbi:MAG: Gfo/Idh/MocA family oxidoreductase [Nanoarchaeota archaeon]|nr:Gfo/Idh/MocA family oxidoreductase [Nanoarchaeota archaeon]
MLKIGIIGSGFGLVGLVPAFNSIKGCRVVAICANKSEQLDISCNKMGSKNIYTDWQLLLENEDLNAVALAVTPRAQYQIAKVAISKGLHVFAEKPLTVNVAQARELLSLSEKNKITHGIDFIFPEIAEWKKVKELIDREIFGKLKHVSVNWDWLSGDIKYGRSSWKTNVSEGGGVLSFYFSHGLYYLEHLVGKITDVKSLFTYSPKSINGGEVGMELLLKFKNGVTGQAHVSCVSNGLIKHQLIFQCEEGVITLENKNSVVDNFIVKIYNQVGEKQVKVNKDKNNKNEDERVKIVKKLATRFVKACISNQQMIPSFKEGLRVQELIEKIRKEII